MSAPAPHAVFEPSMSFADSTLLPRISGANTVVRQNTVDSAEENFPSIQLQAKMIKQTPMPYQTQEFRSCTTLKKFEPVVRVPDGFSTLTKEEVIGELRKNRSVIVHSDRYSRARGRKADKSSQQQRLQQQGQLVEDARSRMRLREALAHRARHDLHLGGDPVAKQQQQQQQQDLAFEEQGAELRKRRRRLRPLARQQQQQQEPWLSPLGEAESSPWPRRGQLVSHSCAHSLPAQQLSQRSLASFASKAEVAALSSMLVEDAADANTAAAAEGLDKVKLDGFKVEFNRRSDIMAELSRLKAMVLPDFAKDLFVGRGIRLPQFHGINKPRQRWPENDAVLEALHEMAERQDNKTDSSGNIVVSDSADQRKQVFVGNVMPSGSDSQPTEQQHEQTQELQHQQTEQQISIDPFYAFPDVADDAAAEAEEDQFELPGACVSYVSQLRAISSHARAAVISQLVARGLRRLLRNSSTLIGCLAGHDEGSDDWLQRGLALFHDIDRECRGCISSQAFTDVAASLRGSPLTDSEADRLRSALLIAEEQQVQLVEFLCTIPFLPKLLQES